MGTLLAGITALLGLASRASSVVTFFTSFKVKAALILIATIVVFSTGYKIANWKHGAEEATLLKDQRTSYEVVIKRFNKQMLKSERAKLAIRKKYQILFTRIKDVEIPDCTIGVSALGVWNAASD